MALSDNPRCLAILRCVQGGQITNTIIRYAAPDALAERSAFQCATWLWADLETWWKDVISVQVTVLELEVKAWTGSFWETFTLAINEPGNVIGECLPVYNSVSLIKHGDPTTIDPIGAQLFGKGRVAVPGVPETFQDNNVLTAAARIAYDALATAMLSFDNVAVEYTMFLYRGVDTLIVPNPEAWESVNLLTTGNMGTQNTRKR